MDTVPVLFLLQLSESDLPREVNFSVRPWNFSARLALPSWPWLAGTTTSLIEQFAKLLIEPPDVLCEVIAAHAVADDMTAIVWKYKKDRD